MKSGVLREIVLETYDCLIGLELADLAVDGCITKAPCGGEKAGRGPVDRGKGGIKRCDGGGHKRHPSGNLSRPGQPSRLASLGCDPRHLGAARRAAGSGKKRASGPRLRFGRYPREAGDSFSARGCYELD
jgi:hypothetical protein